MDSILSVLFAVTWVGLWLLVVYWILYFSFGEERECVQVVCLLNIDHHRILFSLHQSLYESLVERIHLNVVLVVTYPTKRCCLENYLFFLWVGRECVLVVYLKNRLDQPAVPVSVITWKAGALCHQLHLNNHFLVMLILMAEWFKYFACC